MREKRTEERVVKRERRREMEERREIRMRRAIKIRRKRETDRETVCTFKTLPCVVKRPVSQHGLLDGTHGAF